jgi:hypothetical protein
MAVAAWHRKRAVAAFLLILVAEDDDKLPRRGNQKQPTRQWKQRREERGIYDQLVQELALEDPEAHSKFVRLSKEQLFYIVVFNLQHCINYVQYKIVI